MSGNLPVRVLPVLLLGGKTAAELMTPRVVAISPTATVEEAVTLLIEKHLHAVPVVDETGEAIGVLSRTDVVTHDFHRFGHLQPGEANPSLRVRNTWFTTSPLGQDRGVRVRDLMTPVFYSVPPDTPAKAVVDVLLALGVHRLFVCGEGGSLVGVISTTDVLRHLHEPLTVSFDQIELLCADGQERADALRALAD